MKLLPNILIVDDTPENLLLLEIVIKQIQVNLIQAFSGAEALEKTKGIELAAAILDIRMPEMNGFELAQRLNDERPEDFVPIIFITASEGSEIDTMKGYDNGAIDYLIKPFNGHNLLCKVNVLLQLFEQKQIIRSEAALLKETSDELARVNDKLIKSESKYRSYIEFAPDGIFVTDETGRHIEVNEAACRLTGYSKEELLMMSIKDLLAKESHDTGLEQFGKIVESGKLKTDLSFIHKNGTKRWWALEGVKISGTHYLCFTKDITYRIELEESLRTHHLELEMQNEELSLAKEKSEKASVKYTELFDFAPSGHFTLSSEKEIIELNHSGALLLGISKQRTRLVYNRFDFYISQNTLPVFNSFFLKVFKSKEKKTCEVMLETEDNKPIYLHIEGVLTKNGTQCLLNVVNITDRKLTEKTLQQTSTRLELAARAGGVGVWDLDIIQNNLLWDNQMFALYGIGKKNFNHVYESWLNGVHPDDLAKSDHEIKMAIQGEKEFDTEFRVCWADGSIHNIRAQAIVVRNKKGEPINMIGTNWDITEQKRLEEVLKSSEANFRTLFETMNDMIIVGNMQGEIIYVNNTLYETLNYTEKEIRGMHVLDLNPEASRAEAELIFADMFAGKRDSCPLPLARKNGTLVPAETRVWFGKWNGKDCIFGISKNLSAEQEALQKFNKIFENNPALIAISTIPEGIFTDVNKTFLSKTGYTKEEIIGKTTADLGLFIESEQQRIAAVELEKNGVIHDLEFLIKTKTGEILDGLFSGEIIESHGKKFFLTVMIDVTLRKKAENILKQSESNLAEAQRIAHIGSWDWDMRTDTSKWSKEMFRVFDIDPETFDGKQKSILKVVHLDDVAILTKNMYCHITNGTTPALEYRVIHKDGSVHYLYAEGRMEFDEAGNPIRSIGTVQDITDRKQTEEDLRTANNFLDSIVENIPNMMFIKDAESLRFVRFNKAGEDLIGVLSKDIIGKTDYDLFSLNQADGFIENDRKVLQSREMIDITEEWIQTKSKGTRLLHTKKVPILNAAGHPEYLLGISEDITSLKLAEQTLRISEEKYRTMLNASPDGIFLTDAKGRITDVSEIGIELFGFEKRDELIGKHFSSFVPIEEKQTYREVIEKTLNEGIAQNSEIMIRKKNHTLFIAEASSTLIQGTDGTIFSFMIIIRDISKRKKMETKQIHADRMVNLGEMASGMAHEINQPLNIISLVMDNIIHVAANDDNIEKKYLKTKLDKIFDNITRIRNIIDHVRAFSRSNDDYILTDFDINTSILNAASMISEQFKHLAINLKLNLEKNLPLLTGNTFKFEQVIINLLSNAKDALIEKKTPQTENFDMFIDVRSFKQGESLIAEIIDNGTGISKEDIDHIMLPFYTTKDVGKGTGLGLSISYQIIKEMNGSIEVEGNKFNGTTFRIILKLPNQV